MPGYRSVPVWRSIGWVAALGALTAILVLAILQVNSPAQHIDKSTPAPTATALLGSFLLFSLAAGAGSMAIIQLAKNILGVRAFYQEYKVKRWLAGRGQRSWDTAYQDLIRALGYSKGPEGQLAKSEEHALFNLPVEQLAAQISLAADLAVSYPTEYNGLLEALTGEPVKLRKEPDIKASNPPGGTRASAPVAVPTNLDIRRSYQVRSGVDGLQLYVGQGWRRTVRLGAVLISGVLGVIWVRFLNIYPTLSVAYILSGLILGGFISWFLRDLVAIVERVRS
jgi:hypothetical protein